MIEYAEPNCCSGTIFGTAGHNTLGNKENATPKMSINATAAAALKRCWQAAKPDAALPAGSRLELVCWDPAQNRKCQLPAE